MYSLMIIRLLFTLLLLAVPAAAQDTARIVYLGVDPDPYYEAQTLYTGLSLRDRSRPLEGVRLGFRDTRVLGRALGIDFALDEVIAAPGYTAEAARQIWQEGAIAVLLDLPAEEMEQVLAEAKQDDLFINIRDRSERWREADCAHQLLHSVPSDSMLTDALAQHLRAKGWSNVILLHGQTDRDLEIAENARLSVRKFGLDLVADRAFEVTNDPRRRDMSNVALLSGGVRHDVVWLVDEVGDFGRYVPFTTYAARPVVGSEGLTPRAWHWTFERYGAPQLNQRFLRAAGRDMKSEDWAAWAGVRAVVDAVKAAMSAEPGAIHAALRGPDLAIDLYKGVRGNFRDWNGQLRQPILLTTHNAVIAVAPIEGFEHRLDTLDTLGADRAESTCQR